MTEQLTAISFNQYMYLAPKVTITQSKSNKGQISNLLLFRCHRIRKTCLCQDHCPPLLATCT